MTATGKRLEWGEQDTHFKHKVLRGTKKTQASRQIF